MQKTTEGGIPRKRSEKEKKKLPRVRDRRERVNEKRCLAAFERKHEREKRSKNEIRENSGGEPV